MNLSKQITSIFSLTLALGTLSVGCGDDGDKPTSPTQPTTKPDSGVAPTATSTATVPKPSATVTASALPTSSPTTTDDSGLTLPDEPDAHAPVPTASATVALDGSAGDATLPNVDPFGGPDAGRDGGSPPIEVCTTYADGDLSGVGEACSMEFDDTCGADHDAPSGLWDMCMAYGYNYVHELGDAILTCFQDLNVDQCDADAADKYRNCANTLKLKVCVTSTLPACDSLASDCDEITAAECNKIMSTLSPDTQTLVSDSNQANCFGTAVGMGCGDSFKACVGMLFP